MRLRCRDNPSVTLARDTSLYTRLRIERYCFVCPRGNTPAATSPRCHLERSKQLSVVCVVEPDVRRALRRSEISRDNFVWHIVSKK